MIEVIKYVGRDRDEPEWSDAPFDSIKEASKEAEKGSKLSPGGLFTVEDDGVIKEYWWQGRKLSEHEARVRIEKRQW